MNKLEEGIKTGGIKVSTIPGELKTVKNANRQQSSINNIGNSPGDNKILNNVIVNNQGNADSKMTLSDIQRSWKDILEGFKARRAMVIFASILPGKPIDCSMGILTIGYDEQYGFSKERLEKEENYKVVNEVVSEIMGENLKVKFVVHGGEDKERSMEEVLADSIDDGMLEIIDD